MPAHAEILGYASGEAAQCYAHFKVAVEEVEEAAEPASEVEATRGLGAVVAGAWADHAAVFEG